MVNFKIFDMKKLNDIFKLSTKYLQVSLVISVYIPTYSCKNRIFPMTSDAEIVFHIPAHKSYKFEIKETVEFENTFDKEQKYKYRETDSTQLSFLYKSQDSIKQRANMLVQFEKANNFIDIQGAEKAENPPSPYQQSLKAFDGAIFNITLTPHGEVAGFSGYEAFAKNFKSLYKAAVAADELESKQPSHVTPVIQKAFFLNIFDQISNTLCARSIAVGSTWERMDAEEIAAERDIKNVYKCDKIEDGIAYISSTNDQIEKVIKYHDMTMVLRGTMQGEYELDAATGILLKGKRCLNISGSTKLMHGTDFGMTIKKTITINGKRINL
jgi:hypothetical protein